MKKLIILAAVCLAVTAGLAAATEPAPQPAQPEAASATMLPPDPQSPCQAEPAIDDPAVSEPVELVLPTTCPRYCADIYSECRAACSNIGCKADCFEDYQACCGSPYFGPNPD